MNDDINTLAWSPIARDFAAIFREDSERRQRLRECTPPAIWPAHHEDGSHDCA